MSDIQSIQDAQPSQTTLNPSDFLKEIADFTFVSKYARYNEKLGRRETWEEAVNRLEDMHLRRFSWMDVNDLIEIKWAFQKVREKLVVPSLRSLQFGGKAIEKNHLKMYNCAVRHMDSIRAFSEVFFLLLSGCGVGVGLSKKYINRLPDLVSAENKTGTVLVYPIEDTIEGWADSIEVLLMCYFKGTAFTGRKICFDYSKIRRKGTPLKISGGKAPGYSGLKAAHNKIKALLDRVIEEYGQKRLKTINILDIVCFTADAVLSGGIRRAALSALFDYEDLDMVNAKTYYNVDRCKLFAKNEETGMYHGQVIIGKHNKSVIISEYDYEILFRDKKISWFYIEPQRARANISILLDRKTITEQQFKEVVSRTREFGEPGFVFVNDCNGVLYNPCFEVGFVPITQDGVSGVQVCNLTSINGAKITQIEIFRDAVKASTIIGTLQASYTNFPYLSKAAVQLTEEEALLGVSITGYTDNPDVLLNENIQKEMAQYAVFVNKEWAKKIGINQASRVTVSKPDGTSSIVLGTASGIHPHHARRYFRRVQCNTEDNIYKYIKSVNPHATEPSVWSATKTDDVVTFPITVPEKAIVKADLTAIKHLEIIKNTQLNWVMGGTSEANKKDIVHNVSSTVLVADNEWDDVIKYIYDNRHIFAAVSLLPKTGDKIYKQAPMEEITTPEDEARWNELVSKWQKLDFTKVIEAEDETKHSQEAVCAGGACEVTKMS